MAKKEFASLIISRVRQAVGTDGAKYTSSTPAACQSAIAQAITEYITANTVATVLYAGTTPGGSPDVVTDSFSLVGVFQPIIRVNDFNEWVLTIQQNIAGGFSLSPVGKLGVSCVISPFNATPGSLKINQDMLKDISGDDIQNNVWEVICDMIIKWINSVEGMSYVASTTPTAATRSGTSSGTAKLTSILIS